LDAAGEIHTGGEHTVPFHLQSDGGGILRVEGEEGCSASSPRVGLARFHHQPLAEKFAY
jgi:hypothetical protein